MSAETFVAAARELVGRARWRHRGRKPWAVDCIGLLVVAGAKAGIDAPDEEGYGREPWDDRLLRGLTARFGEPVELEADWRPGDIAVIRWDKSEPSHVGILADYPHGGLSIIHAHNVNGVIEHRLAGPVREGVVKVFRPKFGRVR